jgi:signal transduction histidine kinase
MKNQEIYARPESDVRNRDRDKRRFLQPLAVALVSLFFVLLFFSMAMMDLRQLEGVLLDMLNKRAFYVVEGIRKSSQEKYNRLMRVTEELRGLYPDLPAYDETFAIQESLAKTLIDLARYLDFDQRMEPLTHEKLKNIGVSENLHSIAMLDERGEVAFQSAPVPPDVLSRSRGLAEGRQEVAVHLFDGVSGTSGDKVVGFVGIRKHEGKGAVLLVLDKEGLGYWGLRISIREAVEALQRGGGVVYLAVEDAKGRVFARAGSIPEEKVEECLLAAGSARDPNSPVSQCVKVGNVKFLEVLVPFKLDAQAIGKARVGLETRETDELLLEKRRHIFLWTGLMAIIGFLAMGLLYQTQNRHIARLQAVRERLHQAERLSSLAKLGARVAHEVRNPLNAISMATQRLQRDFAPSENEKEKEEFGRIAQIVRDEIRRINAIIEDFLGLSRSDRLDLREQSPSELLDRIVFLVREETQSMGIRIEKQWERDSRLILMDASKMEQALLNIVRNAVHSISGKGTITISMEKAKKNSVSIKVRDTGAGIPWGEQGRIFDAYYTTKQNGTGLGLSIANEIILAHGGEIRVQSELARGTTFEVLLPRRDQEVNKHGG